MNFNYVIIGSSGYYEVGYHDIKNLPNVRYYSSYFDGINNFLLKQIVRWNFSEVVNHYVKTPFSKFTYPFIFRHKFPKELPICFIFFGSSYKIFQSSYYEYLRKHYHHAKMVLFLQDIVSSNSYLNWNLIKGRMDLILSYDKVDCEEYGLLYHPTPMSNFTVSLNSKIPYSDVFFCGNAKSRWRLIHQIYEKLTAKGLVCDFHIMSMPKDGSRISGISYHNDFMNYQDYLQHLIKSKCILEIMQEGAVGYTPRLWESIVYDKHLLTNNVTIKNFDYYLPNNIHLLKELDEVDIAKIIRKKILYSQDVKESLSPIHLLMFIENELLSR